MSVRRASRAAAAGEVFETGAARAGFLRQESEEMKLGCGQAGGDERAERGVGAGDGNDRNAGGDGFGTPARRRDR